MIHDGLVERPYEIDKYGLPYGGAFGDLVSHVLQARLLQPPASQSLALVVNKQLHAHTSGVDCPEGGEMLWSIGPRAINTDSPVH